MQAPRGRKRRTPQAPPQLVLNSEQEAFVKSPVDVSSVLRAGAGSGKTQTLVSRIRRLRDSGATVLVFSHANKTVDEIKERLEAQRIEATVLTMHKYCISRMHATKLPVPHSLDAMMEEAAAAFEEGTLKCYEDHIIVDEANDLSSEQNRIVMALHRQGHCVTLTGDMEQSIYGFQGSSPGHLKAFESLLPLHQRFELCTNYRSSNKNIVSVSNAVASDDIRGGTAVLMVPREDATWGDRPRLTGYRREADLMELLLQDVLSLRDQKGESVMVLAHDNTTLGKAFSHLMAHGVASVLHSSKRSQEFRRIPPRLRRGGVVQLLTIHGAKGGEADHVFLLTGDDRGDSVECDSSDGSESRRLLYVACTRAKSSLKIFYDLSRQGQPCRWLSSAWSFLDISTGTFRFSSSRGRDRRSPQELSVTSMLRENGADGMHDYYSSEGNLEAKTLYSSCIIDLEDSEDMGENIAPQASLAYQLGLEMFMGKLFELHAAVVFDPRRTLDIARDLVDRVCRMCINKEAFSFLQSAQGRAWWGRSGGSAIRHLHHALENEEDPSSFGEIYEPLPHSEQSFFHHAFNTLGCKYRGYESLKLHFARLVAQESRRTERDKYVPAPFERFFREFHSYWDDRDHQRLRGTHSTAFDASVRVSVGSTDEADLCYFAALSCCWEEHSLTKRKPNPEAWQPLLHLAHSPGSPVHLTVDQLKLSEKATAQIRHDANKIGELLGSPEGIEVPNVVRFSCRSEYGDAELSAQGAIFGRADVIFPGGPLEIKALKLSLQAEHSAQVIWYACSTGSRQAWVWDVYRRRLLAWDAPSRPCEFMKNCIMSYLRYNPPPGGEKKIWPQEVSLGGGVC